MAKPKSLQESWDEYCAFIYKGVAPVSPVQLAETKQAFYAGALTMLTAGNVFDLTDPEMLPNMLEYIASLKAECAEFTKSLVQAHVERN